MDNKNFYDAASSFYDQMIGFEKNLEIRRTAFGKLFPNPGSAADLGCGSGVDSIALAMNGHNVLSVDPSSKMLELAKINSEKYSQNLSFQKSTIATVPQKYGSKFNYVISLGNTFANVEGTTIYSTIQRMYDLLVDGGTCLIHILNYNLIAEQQERIVNIKPDADNYYVRFYDFISGQINFNILKFSKNDPKQYELITTRVFGYKKDLLAKTFDSVGFKELKFWSDLDGTKFNVSTSKDLYIHAVKQL